uniref:Uncharacterized protein n=1 Tax=Tanacetum cinerariifolium TaxID=118510 RepID=A0A699JSL9_TANCI|nr:hypothetical protein [Tanacetum cinerariifolium]
MEAANILTSGVAAVSISPTAGVSTVSVSNVSGSVPTVSAIFTTSSVVTPYSRRPRGIAIGDAQHEELGADKSTELGSNDTEEMVNVLSLMEATNILTSGCTAASVSTADVLPAVGVPTVSGSFPIVSEIFTTASVAKRKWLNLKCQRKKLQEQIDAQVAREMEEEFARENQRVSEQLERDFKIVRLHAEEELKMMIEGLDRSIEVILKHLKEYEQAEADLSVREKLELISELAKYQDHRAKILKYQA